MKTSGIENKMATAGETKGGELTEQEKEYVRRETARRAGVWPRVTHDWGMNAINPTEPAEVRFPKSKAHLEAQAAKSKADGVVNELRALVFKQETAVGTPGGGIPPGAENFTPYRAPARDDLDEAEAVAHSAHLAWNRHEVNYHERQRRGLVGLPEGGGIIGRGLRALGLD